MIIRIILQIRFNDNIQSRVQWRAFFSCGIRLNKFDILAIDNDLHSCSLNFEKTCQKRRVFRVMAHRLCEVRHNNNSNNFSMETECSNVQTWQHSLIEAWMLQSWKWVAVIESITYTSTQIIGGRIPQMHCRLRVLNDSVVHQLIGS